MGRQNLKLQNREAMVVDKRACPSSRLPIELINCCTGSGIRKEALGTQKKKNNEISTLSPAKLSWWEVSNWS